MTQRGKSCGRWPCLSMRLFWGEVLRQASEMLAWWKIQDKTDGRGTARNLLTLTLHVLSRPGFWKSYPFQDSTEAVAVEKAASPINHRHALSLILENAMVILIFGTELLARLSGPKKLVRFGQATVTFKKYIHDGYTWRKKSLMAMGKSGKGNLMPWLIRASDEGMEVTHARNNTKEGSLPTHAYVRLSIYGNMFIFNTTAQTLTFTIHKKLKYKIVYKLK